MIPEARQLADWFDDFNIKTILESEEKFDQVKSSYQQANGDPDLTLEILKRDFPAPWKSNWEDDPGKTQEELTTLINKIKDRV